MNLIPIPAELTPHQKATGIIADFRAEHSAYLAKITEQFYSESTGDTLTNLESDGPAEYERAFEWIKAHPDAVRVYFREVS